MDNRLLLKSAITLLYRESLLGSATDNSNATIRRALAQVKIPEMAGTGIDNEHDVISGLKQTALHMCENPADHFYDKDDLLHRLKLNCAGDEPLYDILKESIDKSLNEGELKRSIIHHRRELDAFDRDKRLEDLMYKQASQFRFKKDEIVDMKAWVSEFVANLEPFSIDSNVADPAIITEVDVSDRVGMNKLFAEIADMESGVGIMKSGWQGFNRMTDGGVRRGENIVIGALPHHFKTGFTLSLFRQLCMYNTPHMFDPTKKPLMLRISFEDGAELNIQQTYIQLVELETGQRCDMTGKTHDEMSAYVQEKLQQTGYHVKFLRVDPTQWSFKHITNKLLEYEADGYEIHVCMLDYLGMVPTTGCIQGPAGTDMRDLFRRIRNFTNPRKITLITPHQLSVDAKKKIREGTTGFVQELVGKGYYAGSSQLDQEVDLEIFIHIEIVNGLSYLTWQRGKHRKTRQTPLEHQAGVWQFQQVGGIPDDLNKADTTRKRVGGGVIGSNDEIPFWDVLEAA